MRGWAVVALSLPVAAALAGYKDDIGYTSLSARLGAGTPNGAGIAVTQVEAPISGPPNVYHPDTTNIEFSGKTFTFDCTTTSCDNTTNYSGHATTVASYYYGNSTSIAPGITAIGANEANNWINNYLHTQTSSSPATESRRVQNHSWVVTSPPTVAWANDVNRRVDLFIQRDGVVVADGVNNGTATAIPSNLAPSFNAIAVGLTSGGSSYGPVTVGLDGAGRVKPDIVVPHTATSWATPVVGASAALLLQTEDNLNILSSLSAAQRKVGKAVLTKALLMAGATKTPFLDAPLGIGTWRKGFAIPVLDGSVPLDYRFGAGQLNIDNSHRILTTNAQQIPSPTALVTPVGWSYTTINSGATHQYFFEVVPGVYIAELSCLLTWNRHVSQTGPTLTPTLANLDLHLYEASGFSRGNLKDLSVSTLDNVEHIWMKNLTAGRYVLEVTAVTIPSPATSWEYAVAWNTQTTAANLPPDLDHDGDVDSDDVNLLSGCESGTGVPAAVGCAGADFDGDTDVDQSDFAVMQRCFSGPGVVANPACYTPGQ